MRRVDIVKIPNCCNDLNIRRTCLLIRWMITQYIQYKYANIAELYATCVIVYLHVTIPNTTRPASRLSSNTTQTEGVLYQEASYRIERAHGATSIQAECVIIVPARREGMDSFWTAITLASLYTVCFQNPSFRRVWWTRRCSNMSVLKAGPLAVSRWDELEEAQFSHILL